MRRNSKEDLYNDDLNDGSGIELLSEHEDSNGTEPEIVDGVDVHKLIHRSLWEDVLDALNQAKYTLLIVLLLSLAAGYHLTIGRYAGQEPSNAPIQHTWDTLKYVRPVLTGEQMDVINQNTLYAETTLKLPNNDAISFRFQPTANKYGSFQLPELFYHGVCFSIGLGNSHDVDYSGTKEFTLKDLFLRLESLNPRPMYVAPRITENHGVNMSEWSEEGFLVYYSYKQLDEEGLLSAKTPTQPWRRVSENILEVAREFRQMYVTVYYAHAFGHSTTNHMLKLAERNRKRRLQAEAHKSVGYSAHEFEGRMADDETPVQHNVYYLARGYDGEYTHSIDRREITMVEDEVSHYRKMNPAGPKVAPKPPMSASTKKMDRRLAMELEVEVDSRGAVIKDTSVISAVQNDFVEHGYPVQPEERVLEGDVEASDFKDVNKHKFETVVQEVLPSYTGLDKIRSKCAVWLSQINHASPSEIILDTFETLSGNKNDNEKSGKRSLQTKTTSFLDRSAEYRKLRLNEATEVELPYRVDESSGASASADVEYFDYLVSSKGYNHVQQMESFNVVYKRPWTSNEWTGKAEDRVWPKKKTTGTQSFKELNNVDRHWTAFPSYKKTNKKISR